MPEMIISPAKSDQIDRDACEPAYAQLANILRRQIAEGAFRPGDQLPSEAQLCRTYGISPMTVRRSINLLSDQGVVNTAQGKGTFVKPLELGTAVFDHNHGAVVQIADALAGFFARMVNGGLRAVVDAYVWPSSVESGWASRNRATAARASTAAAVDEGEARWLAERIGRDGKLHESEAALLSFIGREAPSIHAELEPLLARAG